MAPVMDLLEAFLSCNLSRGACDEDIRRENDKLFKQMVDDAASFCIDDNMNPNTIDFMENLRL